MREGWSRVAFADFLTQTHRPELVSEMSEVPFAGARWYAGGIYHRDTIAAADVKTKSLNRIRRGDITYNRMWATKASFGVVHEDTDGCLVTNDFPIFSIDEAIAFAPYLEYLFHLPSFQMQASLAATGTTERRRLKERDFLTLSVDFPPVEEQQRIVDLLESLDNAIEAADGFVACALDAYSNLLNSLAVRGYPEVRVGDVVSIAKAGGTPSRKEANNFRGHIPWLKSGEVDNGSIREASEYISELGLSCSSAWLAPAGSVVVAMYGQGNTKGKAGYLTAPVAMNQAVLALVPDTTKIEGRLLFHLMRSRTTSLRSKAVGAAQPNLSKAIITDELIPLPPLESQSAIVAALDATDEVLSQAREFRTALRTTRIGLLTVLLSGEHEIPKSYDVDTAVQLEPAA